jgi:hypothetical protein
MQGESGRPSRRRRAQLWKAEGRCEGIVEEDRGAGNGDAGRAGGGRRRIATTTMSRSSASPGPLLCPRGEGGTAGTDQPPAHRTGPSPAAPPPAGAPAVREVAATPRHARACASSSWATGRAVAAGRSTAAARRDTGCRRPVGKRSPRPRAAARPGLRRRLVGRGGRFSSRTRAASGIQTAEPTVPGASSTSSPLWTSTNPAGVTPPERGPKCCIVFRASP